MKFYTSSYFPLFVLLFVFLLAELFIWPVAEFPLNDDWCYSNSVKILLEQSRFDAGTSMASLFAHVLWGAVVVKIFGFSYTVLRFSSLFLALLSTILFYRLIFRVSQNKTTAFLLSAFLIFNPIGFLLANTFMTDASYIFSVVLILFCTERYLNTSSWKWLLCLSLGCVYSVLIRQYGMAGGAALAVMIFFERGGRRFLLVIPLIASVIAFFLLTKYIESSQPGTGVVNLDSVLKAFDSNFFKNAAWRFSFLMAYSSLFTLPFSIPIALHFFRRQSRSQLLFTFSIFLFLCRVSLEFVDHMPFGNIFGNLYLGPETFYEAVILYTKLDHVRIESFDGVLLAVTRCGLVFTNFIVASGIVLLPSWLFSQGKTERMKIFILFFTALTSSLVFVTGSLFDRYWLPLLPPVLLFFAFYNFNFKWVRAASILVLAVIFLFSVLATRDYFEWNKARWKLTERALTRVKDPLQINAGIEYYGSRFSDLPWGWWYCFSDNNWYYYIGFEKRDPAKYKVADYELYRRYLPCKQDTIFLSKRLDLE